MQDICKILFSYFLAHGDVPWCCGWLRLCHPCRLGVAASLCRNALHLLILQSRSGAPSPGSGHWPVQCGTPSPLPSHWASRPSGRHAGSSLYLDHCILVHFEPNSVELWIRLGLVQRVHGVHQALFVKEFHDIGHRENGASLCLLAGFSALSDSKTQTSGTESAGRGIRRSGT